MNRTLLRLFRSAMSGCALPRAAWAELTRTAAYQVLESRDCVFVEKITPPQRSSSTEEGNHINFVSPRANSDADVTSKAHEEIGNEPEPPAKDQEGKNESEPIMTCRSAPNGREVLSNERHGPRSHPMTLRSHKAAVQERHQVFLDGFACTELNASEPTSYQEATSGPEASE
ncbi:hypothetical protein M514_02374 [Trichuris suis]|uniref:Uncharacterized protein n=1 Tax=Trichuris suis TaxID=68888 RepID=A0A085MHK2_9BILA|nr:hypothetical protein M513_02374 [Trichuris suis]KFD66897.1 hypothetical protein M514_02374 [Trichuris suis]